MFGAVTSVPAPPAPPKIRPVLYSVPALKLFMATEDRTATTVRHSHTLDTLSRRQLFIHYYFQNWTDRELRITLSEGKGYAI
jgi:hypothetical protein